MAEYYFIPNCRGVVQLTRPSEGTYLEQIAKEMGSVQFFAQLYAEYHTKSLVCSVGWNHVKFQHFYHHAICLKIGGRGKVVLEFYLVILFCGDQFYEVLIW